MRRALFRGYLKARRLAGKADDRIVYKYGLKEFGLHPKNVFNFRNEFFVENVTKDDVVLDLACGTGLILKKVSPRIKRGYGIDFSDSNLRICRAKHSAGNLEYIKGDILEVDYGKLKGRTGYNTLILSHILEHVKDVPALLRKAGAERLLICVPSQENWRSSLLMEMGIPHLTDSTHYREYTRETLRREVERAGYRVEYMGFNPEGEIVCRASKSR